MSAERWQRVERLFESAVDLPAVRRDAYLQEACGGDAELRREVESLIESHQQAGSFIEVPVLPGDELMAPDVAPPQRLGPYRILRELGHGGMGRVFLAEQEGQDFCRRVAVKVVDPAGAGAEVERRFRDERRILAGLEHPGIARLYDAGRSPEGTWFLALEYVEGEDLRAFVERRGLDVRARVELFLQVLDAVDFAHRRLVVHRDLKPGNVLVDAQGRAKLLDFGISKILGPESIEEAEDTRTERPAFTLAYASPEQLRGERATIGTDVYSAGVMLYEILAGRRPFDRRQAPGAEPEPEPPSTVAAQPLARRGLARDLDAITLKALRPSTDGRYPSAAAFAADLRRWLAGEPVEARRGGPHYRLRKFAARHRVALGAAAAVLAALAAGLSLALVQRSHALAAQARAEAEARKARAVKEYLVSVFEVADPLASRGRSGGEVTAQALLDQGAARLDSVLAGQPHLQAELMGMLGRVYVNLGLYEDAGRLLRRSLDQNRAVYGARHAAVAEAMGRLGDLLTRQNRYAEAEPLLRDALAQRRELLGDRDEATAASIDALATYLQQQNDYGAAEPLFREALAMREAIHGQEHPEVASSLNNLGLLLYVVGRYEDAEPLYRRALAICERTFGESHAKTATTMHNLAQVLSSRGRADDAEAAYRRALDLSRRALGDVHPDISMTLNNLGSLLSGRGRLDEAEPLLREALALDLQMFGEHHDYTAESLRNLATLLRRAGDFDEAARTFLWALEVNRSLFGEEHTRTFLNLFGLAITRQLQGELGTAIPLFRRARAVCRRVKAERHPNCLVIDVSLARALLETGSVAEAEALARPVVVAQAARGKPSPTLLEGQAVLARALARKGRAPEALAVAEPALQSAAKVFGPDDWRLAEVRLSLGEALAAAGRHAESEPVLAQAAAALARQRRAQPSLARQAAAALARARR